jgi:hypothetical protein
MKKNTIEILADGEHKLPIGTNFKRWIDGRVVEDFTTVREISVDPSGYVSDYQVDFSELPPLYPTKGMEVPEDGIEFADGDGKLVDVGVIGFTFIAGKELDLGEWNSKAVIASCFQLKRTLPKTITVCADCFKEVCECEHEEGWYRVYTPTSEWMIKYYKDNTLYNSSTRNDVWGFVDKLCKSSKIDWNNPISVTPEVEE